MNSRQAKRRACRWAADVLASQPGPSADNDEDRQRVERAAQQLIHEMERRGGVDDMLPSTFDVPLFVFGE